jgi:hypothetical protein
MPRRQSGQNYQHLSIHGQWNIRISEFKLGAFSTSNNFHRGLSRPENRLSRACLVYKGWAFSMPGCSSMLVWRRFWPQPIVQPEQNQLWSTFLQIFPAQIKVHIRSSFFKLLRRITCPRHRISTTRRDTLLMLGGRADIGLHTPARERRPCS